MPYVSAGKENSGDIDLYYEDHGAVTLSSLSTGIH
jgi:hypothetical protein